MAKYGRLLGLATMLASISCAAVAPPTGQPNWGAIYKKLPEVCRDPPSGVILPPRPVQEKEPGCVVRNIRLEMSLPGEKHLFVACFVVKSDSTIGDVYVGSAYDLDHVTLDELANSIRAAVVQCEWSPALGENGSPIDQRILLRLWTVHNKPLFKMPPMAEH